MTASGNKRDGHTEHPSSRLPTAPPRRGPLRALGLNCTLKPSPADSSTQLLMTLVLSALANNDVETAHARVVDHAVKPGVSSNEGDGDEWPALRRRIVASDILVLATPIWLGKPSSVAQRVLERLDAFLGEADDAGRLPGSGIVALAVVVGNEDGAHHVWAELFQALSDVGFTIPGGAGVYWVGEAMAKTDFKDLSETPAKVEQTLRTAASQAAHLARLLRDAPYPG